MSFNDYQDSGPKCRVCNLALSLEDLWDLDGICRVCDNKVHSRKELSTLVTEAENTEENDEENIAELVALVKKIVRGRKRDRAEMLKTIDQVVEFVENLSPSVKRKAAAYNKSLIQHSLFEELADKDLGGRVTISTLKAELFQTMDADKSLAAYVGESADSASNSQDEWDEIVSQKQRVEKKLVDTSLQRNNLKKDCQEYKQQLADLQKELKTLSSQQQQVRQLATELNIINRENVAVKAECEKLQNIVNTNHASKSEAKQLTELTAKYKRLDEQKQDLEQQIVKIKSDTTHTINIYNQQVTNLQNDLKMLYTQKQENQELIQTYKNFLSEQKAEIALQHETVNKLQKQHETLKLAYQFRQLDIQEKQQEIDRLINALHEANETISKLQDNNKATKSFWDFLK